MKSRHFRYYLFGISLLVVVFQPAILSAQQLNPDRELGTLFTRYYSPKEYNNFSQNWAALQDSRGIMVFANGNGILKFDGVQWEFHSLPNQNVLRSLAMDESGRVYTGAYDELGYLDADSLGNFRYVSLNSHLSDDQLSFGNTHKTYFLNGSIIFQTDKGGFYIWENEKFHQVRWTTERDYQMSFLEGQVLYVQQSKIGLCRLNGNKIELLKGGEFFKGLKVREVLPFDNELKLILTAQHGMYLFNEKKTLPFKTEIDDFLKTSLAYCGIQLPNGNYAIGTLNGGVFIIDKKGHVKSIHNKSTGLGTNEIFNFCLDRQGALWVALSNGISRIEIQTPITHFLQNGGTEGSINGITRFHGILYVGTSQGLYQLISSRLPNLPAHFEKVDDVRSGVWGMINLGDDLVLNTDLGTYVSENNGFRKIDDHSGNSFHQYRKDPNILFSALINGVGLLRKVNGRWESGGIVSGIKAETYDIEETGDGSIWVSTFSEGLFLLRFQAKGGKIDYLNPAVTNFRENEGLEIGFTRIHRINGRELFFVKRDELPDQSYLFDADNGKFEEYNDFVADLGLDGISGYPVTNEEKGRFWLQDIDKPNNKLIITRRPDKTFDVERISFSRMDGYKFRILFEEGDIAWWGGHDGLIRVETSKFREFKQASFDLQINKISLSHDSTLFAGTNEPLEQLDFPYKLNSIRFEYTATTYDNHEENQYQYLLEGFDDEWSSWSKETFKSYTKIPEGSYIFKVRGKDIYGNVSNETHYAFTISPPWFRSWWMFIFYAVGIALVITIIFRWRLSRIRQEKENLEQLVDERTREVKAQSVQLEQQAAKLLELDQAKSYFFANISHEFRTPLTLILGILRDLQDKNGAVEEVDKIAIMQRNAERLQNLINQLLDLSKLESKELKLNVKRGDINWYLKSIASGFSSYAIQRNIDYQIHISDGNPQAFFDADKLEKIITNLLSNAFKFTPRGGTIAINSVLEKDVIKVNVEDSGPGIPTDQLQRIFERFYQVDSTHTRMSEGAGIGLALTKELIELHRGSIAVRSQEEKGSNFEIILPITSDAFSPDELASDGVNEGMLSVSVSDSHQKETTDIPEGNGKSDDLPILLIVEDNADLRQFICGHLKGFKIMEAINGLEGLKKAKKFIPDLVISDIMMPEMDGVELCMKLKDDEKTSHIPVVLLTAKADIESRLEGLNTGADDYITKPFHARELQVRVKNLIRQREKLKLRFSRSVILKPKDIAITSRDEIFLQKLMSIVEEHLGDSEFSIRDFQREIGMSRMQLHRKLKALTGHSVSEFVRIQRLIRAGEMLLKGGGNVSEVCYDTGFTNLSYFSKSFKTHFGIAPKDYASQASV